MQEAINDNYTDINLYCLFHIHYKDIELITNKKHQQLHHDAIFAGAAALPFQQGGFVNKANWLSSSIHMNL